MRVFCASAVAEKSALNVGSLECMKNAYDAQNTFDFKIASKCGFYTQLLQSAYENGM